MRNFSASLRAIGSVKRWRENSKNRVLALVPEAFGGSGGIAQAGRELINALAELREIDRIDVLPRNADGPFQPTRDNVYHHRPRASRLEYSVQACRLAITHKHTLVYCSHLFMSPLAATVAHYLRAKLILHLHGIEIWYPPSRLQRRALERADLLLCVSRHTRAMAVTWANIRLERAIVQSNTIGDEFIPGDGTKMRRRLLNRDAFILLTVSRLDPREQYKGHERVIRLMPRLIRSLDLVYVIVGSGDDRPRLEQLAKDLQVSHAVQFFGNASTLELVELYRAADLFVLPSIGEGFGTVFLEAMSCGTPALGIATGGAVDPLCDGELGTATPEECFDDDLELAIRNRVANPYKLSAAVHSKFGRQVYRTRLNAAIRAWSILHPRHL